MKLHDDVSSWQDGWATAPIYGAGVEWTDSKGKTHVSDGKQPYPESRYILYTPQLGAQKVVNSPGVFSALGIWFGHRSNGLVCLDIDGNLDRFLGKHPSILEGAHIKSPKTDRAKVLFQVPEELWPDVKGYDNSTDTYQVLWEEKMGVCAGEYGEGGEYTYVPGEVPVAPDWLLDGMKAAKKKREKLHTTVPKDWSHWTDEETIAKIQGWLDWIPFEGDWLGEEWDTEAFWFRVGCCIAGAGLGEKGCALWEYYSQKDTRYKDDWRGSNPCYERWEDLTVEGLGPGSLEKLATQYHPDKPWLSEALRAQLKRKEELKELEVDSHEELMKALKAAMEHEDPSKVQLQLNAIAQANGFRDSGAMSKLLLAHEEFTSGSSSMTIAELFAQCEDLKPDFIIPDLFSRPSTLLFHGRGGSGKTMTAMHIAMHVARGIPYTIKGEQVPVQKGRVLWLNGDQNPARLYRQFMEAGLEPTDDIVIENHVSMLWQPWIIRKIKAVQPRLIVWDSVTSCMRGAAVDQNRAEYADPLYFLSMRNGTTFPAVGQLVIHHSNQEGGARGTTALEDAVDEVWSIRKPNKDENITGRVIEIGKSREDNSGRKFYVTRNEDYTLKIQEDCDLVDKDKIPQSSIDQLLLALRGEVDWVNLEHIKGYKINGSEAVRKANLTRLVSKGLVERRGKVRSYEYRAVLARVISDKDAATNPETHVPDKGEGLVATLVTGATNTQEKYETQKTISNNDSNAEEVLLKRATSENPGTDRDLPSSSSSYQTLRARDPFDSSGVTDCDSDEIIEVATTPVETQLDRDRKALKNFLGEIGKSGTVEDVIDIEGEVT